MDNAQSKDLDDTANIPEKQKASIEVTIQTLVHACRCHEVECSMFPKCKKMKNVIVHTKICTLNILGGCPICKQLLSLCVYHAKICTANKCMVPFCFEVKKKLQGKQQLELLITKDQRNHVADLLLDTVSSNTLNSLILGQKISDKISYAKKLESEIYKTADTHDDYYRLLAAKKWEIEMDIEERQREDREIDTIARLYF